MHNAHGAVWHVDDTVSPVDVILQEGDDVMSTVGAAWQILLTLYRLALRLHHLLLIY